MRYICTNCSYIYDEDLGDLDSNIPAGTKFYDLWDYYTCPVCSELPDIFHEIKEEINYIQKSTIDKLEQSHFIDIKSIDKDNIKISIWKEEIHPCWLEHRITSIWLYDEYWDIVDEVFLEEDMPPETDFDISDLDEYEVRVRCTIHWVWARKVVNYEKI